ncbi:MAG: hypothetical protein ACRDWA_10510 [Acidimicrobiia bacterium]
MSDLSWRIIILGVVAVAALFSIWRSSQSKRAKPVHVARSDLGPGVHFFSSETCATCLDTRRVLQSVYGDAFREVRFEDDPAGFGSFAVSSVPTIFVLGPDGNGIRLEGVPSPRQLRSDP